MPFFFFSYLFSLFFKPLPISLATRCSSFVVICFRDRFAAFLSPLPFLSFVLRSLRLCCLACLVSSCFSLLCSCQCSAIRAPLMRVCRAAVRVLALARYLAASSRPCAFCRVIACLMFVQNQITRLHTSAVGVAVVTCAANRGGGVCSPTMIRYTRPFSEKKKKEKNLKRKKMKKKNKKTEITEFGC